MNKNPVVSVVLGSYEREAPHSLPKRLRVCAESFMSAIREVAGW